VNRMEETTTDPEEQPQKQPHRVRLPGFLIEDEIEEANLPAILRVFSFLLPCGNVRCCDPFHPSHHDLSPTCEPGASVP
jgi:hypothetical protein